MFGYVSILCLCLHLVLVGQGVQMRNGRDPKSVAEQVHEKLLEAREQKLLSREMVNVIEAWKARLGLRSGIHGTSIQSQYGANVI